MSALLPPDTSNQRVEGIYWLSNAFWICLTEKKSYRRKCTKFTSSSLAYSYHRCDNALRDFRPDRRAAHPQTWFRFSFDVCHIDQKHDTLEVLIFEDMKVKMEDAMIQEHYSLL